MSKLTDAIKQHDTATALDLINGMSLAGRWYKKNFEFFYGNLLEADENKGNDKDTVLPGFTPLQLAAKLGALEVVNALLNNNVNINAAPTYYSAESYKDVPDDVFISPLNIALANGHDSVAAKLIEAGADVQACAKVDPKCFNELILPLNSMRLPSNRILDGYLCDYIYKETSIIFVAVEKCSAATIRKLALKGAKISCGILTSAEFNCTNHVDYGSGSILMNAVLSRDDNDVAIIECLLELGADPNKFIRCRVKDTHDGSVSYAQCHTALSLAVEKGKVEFAKALMQHGATLWPTKFCEDHLLNVGSEKNWFEVKPEIIAVAQQIAMEIGINLQPPANYPDRHGRIEQQILVPQYGQLIAQPALVHNEAPLADHPRARTGTFFYNAYLSVVRRLSNFNVPVAIAIDQRLDQIIDDGIPVAVYVNQDGEERTNAGAAHPRRISGRLIN